MESRPRFYQDFEPSMEWVPEDDDSDTLLVYLPGFAKEQLRVQLRARNLIISGKRNLHKDTWSRFRVEFPVSGNCDLNKISAKFEENILFVRQPKLITPAEDVKPPAAVTIQSNAEKKQDEDVPEEGVCENESEKKVVYDKKYKRAVGAFLKRWMSNGVVVVLLVGLAIAIYVSDSIKSMYNICKL